MSARLRASTAVAVCLIGCGGSTTDGLFSPKTNGAGGSNHIAPWENGGASFGSGGGSGAGGFGSGAGGTLETGGFAGSTGGASTAGAGGGTGCDFGGTWASYIVAPVTWPATPNILYAGSGNLQQWNLSHQTMNGTNVEVDTVPCGIFLPDLQSDFLGGYAKFGIRFPENIFDDGAVPTTHFTLRGEVGAGGNITFQTDPFAIILGLSLPDPVSDAWPAVGQMQLVDHDLDQKPGITVVAAPGMGYSFPPCDLGTCKADLIFIAERTVSSLSGSVVSCDEVRSDVTIETVDGKPGINSTVVGCRNATTSTDCTADNAAFIDLNRPQYTPSATGTMITVRMPDGASCKDVRARFPRQ
ncbi:MAG TPA: hypothetical protein VHE30_20640 [Polyangiaceae bacterium]|nr:hypothetical protein [Polyangiaceae bacterium]